MAHTRDTRDRARARATEGLLTMIAMSRSTIFSE
jgi:hypothetical protein